MRDSTDTQNNGEDVILVVPPVLYPSLPTLGTSVLAPACVRAGISTRIVEANIAFAARVGFDFCSRLAATPPWKLLGEAIFMAAAFPERAHEHSQVLKALAKTGGPGTVALKWIPLSDHEIAHCVTEVPCFVSEIAERLLASSPRIIGLSTMGQQTLASIAIARKIKKLHPDVLTVLGGSNATEPVGSTIIAMTDAFDFVFSGEADITFPDFCRAYLERGDLPDQRIINCTPIDNLDNVPEPNYEDYFRELEPHRAGDSVAAQSPNSLLFESSRGCWWADKLNCTFCGYITPGTNYRVKSPDKILEAIDTIVTRYGVRHIRASDTIMPADFPKTVLPRLIESGTDCSIAFEVKPNLKEADLDTFTLSGVTEIQPGIESLSSHVLSLMSKGINALDNVRLLRDGRSRGIEIIWNFLTAFPGETSGDYEMMISLVPYIEHLRAPVRWGPIHISRYSPYYRNPNQYGIRNIRAWPAYVRLFSKYADNIATNFDADYETGFTRNLELMAQFDTVLDHWTNSWLNASEPPCLESRLIDGGRVLVHDSRNVAKAPCHLLESIQAEAIKAVRSPISASSIPEVYRTSIYALVDLGLVAFYEEKYLSLITEPEIGLHLQKERKKILYRSQRSEANRN